MEGVGPFQARGQSGGLRGGKGGWARAVGPPWGRQGPGAWAGEESGLMLGLRGLAWWAEAEPGVQAGRREDGRHPGSLRVFGPCRELTLVASEAGHRAPLPSAGAVCHGEVAPAPRPCPRRGPGRPAWGRRERGWTDLCQQLGGDSPEVGVGPRGGRALGLRASASLCPLAARSTHPSSVPARRPRLAYTPGWSHAPGLELAKSPDPS